MRALLQRLSGLDDVAKSAVRIIELFDRLAQQRLALEELVRSAATTFRARGCASVIAAGWASQSDT